MTPSATVYCHRCEKVVPRRATECPYCRAHRPGTGWATSTTAHVRGNSPIRGVLAVGLAGAAVILLMLSAGFFGRSTSNAPGPATPAPEQSGSETYRPIQFRWLLVGEDTEPPHWPNSDGTFPTRKAWTADGMHPMESYDECRQALRDWQGQGAHLSDCAKIPQFALPQQTTEWRVMAIMGGDEPHWNIGAFDMQDPELCDRSLPRIMADEHPRRIACVVVLNPLLPSKP